MSDVPDHITKAAEMLAAVREYLAPHGVTLPEFIELTWALPEDEDGLTVCHGTGRHVAFVHDYLPGLTLVRKRAATLAEIAAMPHKVGCESGKDGE